LIRGRLLRRRDVETQADEFVEIDPRELAGLFEAPQWLRDLGFTAWLLFGLLLLVAGLIWALSLIQVIVIPVIVAGVVAAVAEPLVSWLHANRVPRALGAALVLVAIVAAGALAGYLVLDGIGSQSSGISQHLTQGADKIQDWVQDLGVGDGKAAGANHDLSSGAGTSFHAMISGVIGGIEKLSSMAFFLVMTVLSLFFLLKDGPVIRAWSERHMGVPPDVAHSITRRTAQSMRGYFLGVTIVALFSATLVGLGALLLGVPLAGTIAVVTFIGGYIPYLGAWGAGAFSVLLALGGSGPEAAGGMVGIQLLSNGPLQQLVQPVAYGAALGIHPLAVLIVTIAGGALFGAVGLILAAPLTSAVVRISADLARARVEAPPATAAAASRAQPP
jgi:predicted PurR-regulated permease PerM